MFYSGRTEGDKNEFQRALTSLSSWFNFTYANDNLIVFDRSLSFAEDPRFQSAFDKAAGNNGQARSLMWRLHIAGWVGKQAQRLPGDFVECGVFHGLTSYFLCEYLQFGKQDRTFWLYDSFKGLDPETATEAELSSWDGTYSTIPTLADDVRKRFSQFDNVRVMPGWLPGTLHEASPTEIAFLHLDLNSVHAEIQSLECLYDRITPGGFVLLDDYGWAFNAPQMQAERAFFQQRKITVLELPTGQGLVMKP